MSNEQWWQEFATVIEKDENLVEYENIPTSGSKSIYINVKCNKLHDVSRSAYLILHNIKTNNDSFRCYICSQQNSNVKCSRASKKSVYKSIEDVEAESDICEIDITTGETWIRLMDNCSNYLVSNFGNVKFDTTQHVLSPEKQKGYYRVVLSCGSRDKKIHAYVHTLVAICFLPKEERNFSVDHIDRNKLNNHATNLRWATTKEQRKNQTNPVEYKRGHNYSLKPIEGEIWRTTQHGIYVVCVSNFGRFKTKYGIITLGTEKELYYTCHNIHAHRFVAKAFLTETIPPNPDNHTVNHKDGNGHNNKVENLEWATYPENANHALALESNNHSRRVKQMDANGQLIAIYPSTSEAGRMLKISDSAIFLAMNGGSESAGGYCWAYASNDDVAPDKPPETIVKKVGNTRAISRTIGDVTETFASTREASEKTTVGETSIWRFLKGDRKPTDGAVWKYVDENVVSKKTATVPVEKVDMTTGDVVQTFASIKQASRECGIGETKLRTLLKNGKVIDGYMYVFQAV